MYLIYFLAIPFSATFISFCVSSNLPIYFDEKELHTVQSK